MLKNIFKAEKKIKISAGCDCRNMHTKYQNVTTSWHRGYDNFECVVAGKVTHIYQVPYTVLHRIVCSPLVVSAAGERQCRFYTRHDASLEAFRQWCTLRCHSPGVEILWVGHAPEDLTKHL
jgi:hypothetical protein